MKDFLRNKTASMWLGYSVAILIFTVTIWNSNKFVNQLKVEEEGKMAFFAKAIKLANSEELNSGTQEFLLEFITSNHSIPVALVDENFDVLYTYNIPKNVENDSVLMKNYLTKMATEHNPILIDFPNGQNYVYYRNSDLLSKLRYYPIILIVVIITFGAFSFWYFSTLKKTEQSYLWAGMAKETAHQIGTPLSSLMGWTELLKLEEIDQTPVIEIEKDVNRLSQIVERFSKIGSTPELKQQNLVDVTKKTVEYLSQRISKGVEVKFSSNVEELNMNMNATLFSWVIENLFKNAADAMQNRGVIGVYVLAKDRQVEISVQDTGPGIPIKYQKRIFEPGFSTKKRGWGLGLSLAKRIIEDYHKGKIFVHKSDKSIGTNIKIVLKIA